MKTLTVHNTAALARELMNQHGLGDWVFQYDRAKKRAGRCNIRKKIISLSYHYVSLNDDEDIKDTILHEIAHALAKEDENSHRWHGDKWKAICLQIGAKPIRCYDSNVKMPKGRYRAVCNSCQREFHRHRRPKYNNYSYCLKCGPQKGLLNYGVIHA